MRISDWSSDVCSSDLALKSGTPFWYIAERGVNASKHHEGTMVEQIDLNSWVTMSVNRAVEEIQSRLTGGLSVLATVGRSEEHTSELQSLMRISYAVFCLKKNKHTNRPRAHPA